MGSPPTVLAQALNWRSEEKRKEGEKEKDVDPTKEKAILDYKEKVLDQERERMRERESLEEYERRRARMMEKEKESQTPVVKPPPTIQHRQPSQPRSQPVKQPPSTAHTEQLKKVLTAGVAAALDGGKAGEGAEGDTGSAGQEGKSVVSAQHAGGEGNGISAAATYPIVSSLQPFQPQQAPRPPHNSGNFHPQSPNQMGYDHHHRVGAGGFQGFGHGHMQPGGTPYPQPGYPDRRYPYSFPDSHSHQHHPYPSPPHQHQQFSPRHGYPLSPGSPNQVQPGIMYPAGNSVTPTPAMSQGRRGNVQMPMRMSSPNGNMPSHMAGGMTGNISYHAGLGMEVNPFIQGQGDMGIPYAGYGVEGTMQYRSSMGMDLASGNGSQGVDPASGMPLSGMGSMTPLQPISSAEDWAGGPDGSEESISGWHQPRSVSGMRGDNSSNSKAVSATNSPAVKAALPNTVEPMVKKPSWPDLTASKITILQREKKDKSNSSSVAPSGSQTPVTKSGSSQIETGSPGLAAHNNGEDPDLTFMPLPLARNMADMRNAAPSPSELQSGISKIKTERRASSSLREDEPCASARGRRGSAVGTNPPTGSRLLAARQRSQVSSISQVLDTGTKNASAPASLAQTPTTTSAVPNLNHGQAELSPVTSSLGTDGSLQSPMLNQGLLTPSVSSESLEKFGSGVWGNQDLPMLQAKIKPTLRGEEYPAAHSTGRDAPAQSNPAIHVRHPTAPMLFMGPGTFDSHGFATDQFVDGGPVEGLAGSHTIKEGGMHRLPAPGNGPIGYTFHPFANPAPDGVHQNSSMMTDQWKESFIRDIVVAIQAEQHRSSITQAGAVKQEINSTQAETDGAVLLSSWTGLKQQVDELITKAVQTQLYR